MYFVSVTRLRLRSPWYLLRFAWHNWRTVRQTQRTPGFLGGCLIGEARRTFWTITVWEQQAAMAHLRNQGAHKRVMPYLQTWCDEAAVAHWQQDTPTVPTLTEAYERLQANGHWTRLQHGSTLHQQRQLTPPRGAQFIPLRPQAVADNHRGEGPPETAAN